MNATDKKPSKRFSRWLAGVRGVLKSGRITEDCPYLHAPSIIERPLAQRAVKDEAQRNRPGEVVEEN